MATPLPNLDEGPLQLSLLREEARRTLVDALDARRGKKVLVLDPKVVGFLGHMAEVALLKEHGVEQLLQLGPSPLGEVSVRSVVYLVRATVENAQLVAQQVKHINAGSQRGQLDISVLLVPRRTRLCERVFQEEGVFGDLALAEWPLDLVPLDADLLSLELDTAFKEVVLDGDRGSLYYTARAIMRLQALFGGIRSLRGKGPAAAAVKDMLGRMRRELGADAPAIGSGQIDAAILVDREVDSVTPMVTQLTYEGLLDEVLHIRHGHLQLDQPGGAKQRVALSSADRVFRELRDLSFAAAGARLGERAKGLQSDYAGGAQRERSLEQLKAFAQQLRALPGLQRHISLAETVNAAISRPGFRERIQIEQQLLDGHAVDACCDAIEAMIWADEDLLTVLRLLCLVSLTNGGVPKKHWDSLRREILHTYGHHHMLTLSSLQTAGLLRKAEGSRNTYAAAKRAWRLLVEDVDEHNPTDTAYVFAGYAPLSIRLVEAALRPSGWAGLEDALDKLAGPHFDVVQATDENGLPVELPATSRTAPQPGGGEDGRRRCVLVAFLGGATFAEVNALRWLSARPEAAVDFVVLTSRLLNGSGLLDSFLEDSVRAAAQLAAAG